MEASRAPGPPEGTSSWGGRPHRRVLGEPSCGRSRVLIQRRHRGRPCVQSARRQCLQPALGCAWPDARPAVGRSDVHHPGTPNPLRGGRRSLPRFHHPLVDRASEHTQPRGERCPRPVPGGPAIERRSRRHPLRARRAGRTHHPETRQYVHPFNSKNAQRLVEQHSCYHMSSEGRATATQCCYDPTSGGKYPKQTYIQCLNRSKNYFRTHNSCPDLFEECWAQGTFTALCNWGFRILPR